jgi:MFS transporter, PPP family, 3-phenylpropionic acid transporter
MPAVHGFRMGFAPRVAALYAAFFVMSGIQLPFFPLWLKAKGLDPAAIGLVLAAPMVLRILTIPLTTRAADRHNALRGVLMLTCCLTVAGYALVGLTEGPGFILLAYAVAALAFTPIMPLSETYALKGLGALGRPYGPVRLWGSAAFILGNFAAGYALDVIPARDLIWMIVAASALVALVSLALAPLPQAQPAADAPPRLRRGLLRDPAFLAVLAAASLIQASHAVFYGFSALQWRAEGLDGTTIAGLWALGVVAEIVLFALQGRLPPLLQQPTVLLMVGATGAVLRWAAMALDPPVFALPFLQLLHALSFGATHLGALGYVARNAPAGQGATAQGYLAIALGAVMAGAMGLSGVLVEAFGVRAYAAMALVAVAGGACGYVAQLARRQVAV